MNILIDAAIHHNETDCAVINEIFQVHYIYIYIYIYIFFFRDLTEARASSLLRFRYHTETHNTMYDFSVRVISPFQRPLPDNTTPTRDVFLPLAGFELTIPAGERPQTHALDRAATGTG